MTVDWKTDTLYWSTLHNEQLAAYNIITSEVSYLSVGKNRSLYRVSVDSPKNQDGTVIHTVVVDPKGQGLPQGEQKWPYWLNRFAVCILFCSAYSSTTEISLSIL